MVVCPRQSATFCSRPIRPQVTCTATTTPTAETTNHPPAGLQTGPRPDTRNATAQTGFSVPLRPHRFDVAFSRMTSIGEPDPVGTGLRRSTGTPS